ncbi:MAG: BatD family protein [Psychroflexus sp.]|nr:BatD family protein [Psychroflexus sp.]MDR9447592.1 BatD family protein [Psychroflexus sp.]
MKAILRHIILFITLFIADLGWSQVQFTAEPSREKIGINERVKITFKVNQPGDNFTPPTFENFKKVGGPNQSVSQQFINGKSSYELSFIYYLEPMKKGNLSIKQAEITIDGKVYKTSPITVEVGEAVDKPNDKNAVKKRDALNGIHLIAEVSKRKPYLNEPVYVVYKLYVSRNTNVRNWQALDNPDFENFWSRNIDNDQLSVKNGSFAGEPYRYVELRKTVLYPQKTGELKIKPLTLNLSVEVPSDRRDIFGRRLYDVVDHKISAKTKTINVQPLPEQEKPASFTGAVGDFSLDSSIDSKQVKQGESVNLELKITGTGNLQLFDLPKLSSPPGIELYEPERKENIKINANGMRGSVRNNYTLVAQNSGKFPISPVTFSYFDLSTKSYKTLTTDEIVIDVESKASSLSPNNSTSGEINTPAPVNQLSGVSSFKYIKLNTDLRPLNTKGFFKSTTYWMLALTPVGLALASLFFFLYRKNRPDDDSYFLQKKQKLAKKYLSNAKQSIDQPDEFYQALELALYNYLKAKLKINTSDITKDKIKDKLKNTNVSSANIDQFISTLSKCEKARYATTASENLENDYKQTAQLITSIDKEIKS